MIKPIRILTAALWLTGQLFAEPPAAPNPAAVPELPLVLTPYLQNPTDRGMTICVAAQGAQEVTVIFGPEGSSARKSLAAKATLIENTPWTMWRVRLTGLQPGTAYQYQVCHRIAGQVEKMPVYHLRTLNPRAGSLRIAAFNDLHNREAVLAALMNHVKPDDFELSVLLGDCFADPSRADGASGVFRTLEAYLRLLDGANKPIIFIRGNHETRGNFSHQLANLFDLPNLRISQKWGGDHWQFTLRAGPVYFLAMDTGEDDNDGTPVTSYKNPNLWQEVRKNEAAWLQQLMAGKPGQNAPWRIFISHMPLYNSPHASVRSRDLWAPMLRDFKPDLMLAGHTHGWKNPLPMAKDDPWPTMIGGGPAIEGGGEGTVMLLEADNKTLKARLLGARDGRVLAEFGKDKNPPGSRGVAAKSAPPSTQPSTRNPPPTS